MALLPVLPVSAVQVAADRLPQVFQRGLQSRVVAPQMGVLALQFSGERHPFFGRGSPIHGFALAIFDGRDKS